jgi:hypothetical protein
LAFLGVANFTMNILLIYLLKQNKSLMSSPSEAALQAACVDYYRRRWPVGTVGRHLLFRVTNENPKSRRRAALDKAMGVLAGAADLVLDAPSGQFHGLKIELKRPGAGRQSPAQAAFQAAQAEMGYQYIIVDSLEKFIFALDAYLDDRANALMNKPLPICQRKSQPLTPRLASSSKPPRPRSSGRPCPDPIKGKTTPEPF